MDAEFLSLWSAGFVSVSSFLNKHCNRQAEIIIIVVIKNLQSRYFICFIFMSYLQGMHNLIKTIEQYKMHLTGVAKYVIIF